MITVFTNGCFDILHVGHVRLLEFASSLGDRLIIGLNSDKSIRTIKGDCRPIINQRERKEILESIKYVDEVIIFDEPNPYSLIKKIGPDILVKGGDWEGKNVIGSDIVKEVIFFEHQEKKSTTCIIEKIKGMCDE